MIVPCRLVAGDVGIDRFGDKRSPDGEYYTLTL
jgi:hypothetical protein